MCKPILLLRRRLPMVSIVLALSGCAVVPAYEREYMTRPGMQPTVDPLTQKSLTKLRRTREVAGGGEGATAGGGCACGN